MAAAFKAIANGGALLIVAVALVAGCKDDPLPSASRGFGVQRLCPPADHKSEYVLAGSLTSPSETEHALQDQIAPFLNLTLPQFFKTAE